MKKMLFVATALLILAIACNKDNQPKPSGPSEGGSRSYLNCKINGKEYFFSGTPSTLNYTGVGYYYGLAYENVPSYQLVKSIYVGGTDLGKQNANIRIGLFFDSTYTVNLGKQINFGEDEIGGIVYVTLRTQGYIDTEYYGRKGHGWIQFSRADSIGAGSFALTAYSSTDSVVVTDGRFDIRQ